MLSGIVSGVGNIVLDGAGTWTVSGNNTFTGTTTVRNGTLALGQSNALGSSATVTVNGGALDLNGNALTLTSLTGSGGAVKLTNADITLEGVANTTYSGSINGTGGLIKRGMNKVTLSGENQYSGSTTVNGGTLALDFSAAGAPVDNILSGATTINMMGGTFSVTGAAGIAGSQTLGGLHIDGGNNRIIAVSGTGGSMTLNLGAITRIGGLVDFVLPAGGNVTTTNTALGGWAIVNGADYAKVLNGNITAFTTADYTSQNDASQWVSGQYVTDSPQTPGHFFSSVNNNIQLAVCAIPKPPLPRLLSQMAKHLVPMASSLLQVQSATAIS